MGTASDSLGPGRANGRSKNGPARKSSGHGPMFGHPTGVQHWKDFPEGGGYPHGFVEWALQEMSDVYYSKSVQSPLSPGSVTIAPTEVLHLCSGSMQTGVRVDIRPETNPDIIGDCRHVPLPDGSFDFIMADPPYSVEYAENLYGTGNVYPKPGQILAEATRLLRPGGLVGLLHHQVPVFKRPLKLHKVYAVHRGLGFGLVAWTLLRKETTVETFRRESRATPEATG